MIQDLYTTRAGYKTYKALLEIILLNITLISLKTKRKRDDT